MSFRPGDRVRHRELGWTGTVLNTLPASTYLHVQADEDSEREGARGSWAARNLEPIGARAEVWTVEHTSALHSLREYLELPTPSSPERVLNAALDELIALRADAAERGEES